MKWIKWLFSLMHVRFWIAITSIPTCILSFWLAPGAAATTTMGILLGMFWYIVLPAICVTNFFYLVLMSRNQWDKKMTNWKYTINDIKETIQGTIDYFSNWWNSRPNKPE